MTPGPFARPAAARTLAVLVVLAVVATAWVGLARRRDDTGPGPADEPSGTTASTAPAEVAAGGLPTAPAPERGGVLPLAGGSGLPDGWSDEAGTWGRDDVGIRLDQPPAAGPAIAVTEVEPLPWATVSLTGPAAGPGWGVVFGYAGLDDHFVVTVDGTTARVLRVEGGAETEVSTQEIPAADEVLVALDVTGRNVAIHVGTTVLPSVQVPTEDAARRVGVRAAEGADTGPLRWTTIGVRARVALDEPLVASGETVTELTPDEARRHLGP
ncbi:MAG TPA: hypothetical protein VF228_00135 [Iamia sp.]